MDMETQVEDKANSSHLTQWYCTHAFQAHAVSIRLTLAFYSILLATWGWKKNQNPSTKRRSKLAILLLEMWVRLNGIQMDMDQSVSKVTNVQFYPIDGRMIMRNHKQTFAVEIRVPSRNPTWNPTNQQFCKRKISTTNAHFSWLPHEFSVALLVFDTYPQHNADPAMGPFAQTTSGGESNKTWIFHPEIRGLSRENGEVKQFHAIFPPVYLEMRWTIYIYTFLYGGLFIFVSFFCFAAGFAFFLGSWFYAFLLLCFSAFPASLLLCFCAFLLYYSTFSFLQSCVFAALLPAPLLLCSIHYLLVFSFIYFALFNSPFCILDEALKTLGETQRNPKEILIRNPDKKPYINPKWNSRETLNETSNETLTETLMKP